MTARQTWAGPRMRDAVCQPDSRMVANMTTRCPPPEMNSAVPLTEDTVNGR